MRRAGAMIDDEEKARLSSIMQQRSDCILSHPAVQDTRDAAKSRRKGSATDELQQLFDRVTQEIEERRAFLAAAVEAVGRGHVVRIGKEIAERLTELRRLDEMLRE